MLFRCGDLIIEAAHDLTAGIGDGAVRCAHTCLEAAGLEVSNVRDGRWSGTEVFTVGAGSVGVPTLVIAQTSAAGEHAVRGSHAGSTAIA
jgi:hypothetical protein